MTDVPLPEPPPGRTIPRSQIPFPDFMVSADDADPTWAVRFRLRGWHDSEAIERRFSSEIRANDAAAQYVALGWGGDATVLALDGSSMTVLDAPLSAPDAPI